MKKSLFSLLGKAPLIFLTTALLFSCTGAEGILGLIPSPPGEASIEPGPIPKGISDLAEGVFSIIDKIFSSKAADPTLDTTYPSGMTVAWVTPQTELRISLSNFAPDTGETRVIGSIVLTQISKAPFTIDMAGSIDLTKHTYSKVAFTGRGLWDTGKEPGTDPPKTITGTFAVDGKTYRLADVVAANSSSSAPAAPAAVAPAIFIPIPETFRTGLGTFSQRFQSRASRAYPSAAGAAWTKSESLGFDISADGARHAVYVNGAETAAGFIHWSETTNPKKIDFWDSGKSNLLYSYTVLASGANGLWLSGPSGQNQEWLFSAGKDNITGIVVDSGNKPISGAQVEIGYLDSATKAFTALGTQATSDANGYFAIAGLSKIPQMPMLGEIHIRVAKASYTTYQGVVPGSMIPIDAFKNLNFYQYITLNP